MEIQVRFFFLLIVTFLVSCSTTPSKYTSRTAPLIQLPEGVEFLPDGKVSSTRCTGYTTFGGRNKGVNEAQLLAAQDAIEASEVQLQSIFSSKSTCTTVKASKQCQENFESYTRSISDGFIARASKKITEYHQNIVCVSLLGNVTNINVEIPKLKVASLIKQDKTEVLTSPSIRVKANELKTKEPVVFTENLLINGQFESHYTDGWELLKGDVKSIAKVRNNHEGVLLSYTGKGDINTQLALAQKTYIDISYPIEFTSEFKVSDGERNLFPAIKLQYLDSADQLIFEKIWTADPYYQKQARRIIKKINQNKAIKLKENLQSGLSQNLSKNIIAQISQVQVVYDVTPPERERCSRCQIQLSFSQLTYIKE